MSRSTNTDAARSNPERGDPWERRAGAGRVLLLLLLFIQGLVFIGESSQTSDEAVHLAAGYSYLTRTDYRLNPEHPPLIKELAALPLLLLDIDFPEGPVWEQADEWNLGRIFVHENRVRNDTLLLLGRLPILILSCILGWLLFHWAHRLFGARAALASLALYVLDPNVVAHSSLITTDLAITLFVFLSVYALWSWSERPTRARLLLLGGAVGAAFASKYTAIWLLPILGSLALVLLAIGAPLPAAPWTGRAVKATGGRFSTARFRTLLIAGSIVLGVTVLIVGASYQFVGLPAYAAGLDRTLSHSAQGHTAYLNGEISDTGWWYYFLFAYLVKTPPGILIVIGMSMLAFLLGVRRPRKDELFLFLPVAIILGITCVWNVNIGLRHLLPIYPFLYVVAGRVAAPWPATPRIRQVIALMAILAVLCIAWSGWEAAGIAPYHLAYFNAFVGGPENGHHYLLDSNLDWGQAAKTMRRYMRTEGISSLYLGFSGNTDPWYYGVLYQYVPGSGNLQNPKDRMFLVPDGAGRELLAVSAMVLHSVHFSEPDLYDWLKDRQPIATPGYAYLVYDITGDAVMHASIAAASLRFGLVPLAEVEARRTLRLDPDSPLARAVLEQIDRLRAGDASG